MTTRTHTSDNVCRIAHITRRQLNYWTNVGLATCIDDDRRGSGHAMRFDEQETQRIKLMALLVGAGLHPRAAHAATIHGTLDDFTGIFRAKLAPRVFVDVNPLSEFP